MQKSQAAQQSIMFYDIRIFSKPSIFIGFNVSDKIFVFYHNIFTSTIQRIVNEKLSKPIMQKCNNANIANWRAKRIIVHCWHCLFVQYRCCINYLSGKMLSCVHWIGLYYIRLHVEICNHLIGIENVMICP